MLDDGLNDSMGANIGNTSHSRKDQEASVQLVAEGDLFRILYQTPRISRIDSHPCQSSSASAQNP